MLNNQLTVLGIGFMGMQGAQGVFIDLQGRRPFAGYMNNCISIGGRVLQVPLRHAELYNKDYYAHHNLEDSSKLICKKRTATQLTLASLQSWNLDREILSPQRNIISACTYRFQCGFAEGFTVDFAIPDG